MPVLRRPNTLLTRAKNAIGIKEILDLLVQLPQSTSIEVVHIGNQVHVLNVSTVLAVARSPGVSYQVDEEFVGGILILLALSVEMNHVDVGGMAQMLVQTGAELEAVFSAGLLGGVIEVEDSLALTGQYRRERDVTTDYPLVSWLFRYKISLEKE